MNSLQMLDKKLNHEQIERVLFCPAIYEHKAKLIGKSISETGHDPGLLTEAVIAEYETYRPDMLTVGMDIYNIEAEAVGSKVSVTEEKNSVPGIESYCLEDVSDTGNLEPVDVKKDGRMSIVTEAVKNVQNRFGDEVLVRGAVSGPFTMAANIIGIEKLVMAQMMQPNEFKQLMDYCTAVIIDFAKTFTACGASVCLFDSQASPPFISPDSFKELILPYFKKINSEFKKAGAKCTELVIGGETEAIAGYMVGSSFDIVLSDFTTDFGKFDRGKQAVIRRNMSPILIENGPDDELDAQVREIVQLAKSHDNVIVGTGVLAYDVEVEKILKLKELIFSKS